MNQVNVGRIDKNFLLAALYNRARPLSEFHVMGTDEAGEIVSEREQTVKGPHIPVAGRDYYFDTIKGRKIEVDLAPGQIDGTRYDERYGKGACYEAVNAARINQHRIKYQQADSLFAMEGRSVARAGLKLVFAVQVVADFGRSIRSLGQTR